MVSIPSIQNAKLLSHGATADIYEWGDGRVLKLFKERLPWHANEVAATKRAYDAGLPVPKVCSKLIRVGVQEAIIFEYVEGFTMTSYLLDNPMKAEECARLAAKLFFQIHATIITDLPLINEILTWSINQADLLEEDSKTLVLNILDALPSDERLCHNDFHPNNIIMAPGGPIVIDWAVGAQGCAGADYARTRVISTMWLDSLEESAGPANQKALWEQFWEIFFHQYEELNPSYLQDQAKWKVVTTAASLVWDKHIKSSEQRLSFIQAALDDAEIA